MRTHSSKQVVVVSGIFTYFFITIIVDDLFIEQIVGNAMVRFDLCKNAAINLPNLQRIVMDTSIYT